MSSEELKKNILATVAYYDVMDYPLTSFELWKYLTVTSDRQPATGNPAENNFSPDNVISALDEGDLKKYIENYRGFNFLTGRMKLVEQRISRDKTANRKLKKLRRIAKILRFMPFVRMIGVTGRLAMKNTPPESDWDLLIVIKHGKIWTGRTLVTAAVQFLGKRRHNGKISDRVCLNHFLSDRFSIGIKDFFSASEYSFLFPLYDSGVFEKFQIRNSWIRKYKVNYHLNQLNNLRILEDTPYSKLVKGFFEKVFSPVWIESALRKWQSGKIKMNPKTNWKTGMIAYTDDELAFWPNFQNQGPAVFERFKNKIKELE